MSENEEIIDELYKNTQPKAESMTDFIIKKVTNIAQKTQSRTLELEAWKFLYTLYKDTQGR